MDQPERWGPLAALAGTWEGDEGRDVSFSHEAGAVIETPYRERVTFEPFGPVDNGTQLLFGLDYRMSAWEPTQESPFHMEVGYWLWDATAQQVMRSFLVPRGIAVLAIGSASADARAFRLEAKSGQTTAGILSNPYLERAARSSRYTVEIALDGDDAFTYDETTELIMTELDEPLAHTDRNRLSRVG